MIKDDFKLTWNGNAENCISFMVIGYQFPEITEGYDANWVTLSEGYHRLAVHLRGGLKRNSSANDVNVVSVSLSQQELEMAIQYFLEALCQFPSRGEVGFRSSKLPGPKVQSDDE